MEFTDDFFSRHICIWEDLFSQLKPERAIEIGSYEGRSAQWLLDNIPRLKLTCIDTWDNTGIAEGLYSTNAEKIFDSKVGGRVKKIKGKSGKILVTLKGPYDLIYIDGDHSASAVLEDMVLSFRLLRPGGIMICDDYTGGWGRNPLDYPKFAIDSFINCYWNKLDILTYPPHQIFIVKK